MVGILSGRGGNCPPRPMWLERYWCSVGIQLDYCWFRSARTIALPDKILIDFDFRCTRRQNGLHIGVG